MTSNRKHTKGKASDKPMRPGDALVAIGRKARLTDEEIAIIESVRDKTPAQPFQFTESKRGKTRP